MGLKKRKRIYNEVLFCCFIWMGAKPGWYVTLWQDKRGKQCLHTKRLHANGRAGDKWTTDCTDRLLRFYICTRVRLCRPSMYLYVCSGHIYLLWMYKSVAAVVPLLFDWQVINEHGVPHIYQADRVKPNHYVKSISRRLNSWHAWLPCQLTENSYKGIKLSMQTWLT